MLQWLQRIFGLGRPQLPPLVLQARSPDPEARRDAAVQLAAVPEFWALDQLMTLLKDSEAKVREAAKASLRQLGVVAIPALRVGLDDSDPQVATVAAELLGELQMPQAVEPLLVALKFNARPVQVAARKALARMGALAVPALEAARDETQPWVRQQIEELLAQKPQ